MAAFQREGEEERQGSLRRFPLYQGLIIPSGEWRNSLLLLNVNCAQLRVTRRFRERVKVRLN